ncbi:MAG: SH3 domain-containing protein [Acetatifactor sp.]
MMKKIKNNFAGTLLLVMIVATLMTPLAVYAAFTQPSRVMGDGVRLRQTPGLDGIILELMYKGESITLSDDVMPPPGLSAWVYVRREKTGTVGWMEWSYFDHNYEP